MGAWAGGSFERDGSPIFSERRWKKCLARDGSAEAFMALGHFILIYDTGRRGRSKRDWETLNFEL
jgi:hypothetical protein